MSVTVIIPARWESSRFPGKPLTPIRGAHTTEEEAEPKSLIRRTWDVANAAAVGPVVVATDDMRIADHVAGFGGQWILTPDCRNGTERCAYAAEVLGLRDRDPIINLQGDALLTPPEWVVLLATWVRHPFFTGIATIACSPEPEREPHPGDVSTALKQDGTALYFSRSRLPSTGPWLLHFGIYGYTAAMLQWYLRKKPGPLELAEGLEQLRFLEYGTDVRPLIAPKGRVPRCEINYPGDVPWAEEELRKWGVE